jgi:SAM-dependent methyltransferase
MLATTGWTRGTCEHHNARVTEPIVDADAFNAFEAAGWESKSAGYDDFLGQITGRLVEPLLDAAGVGPGRRVLEVATGPGYAAARAAERGAVVVGIDVAEAMVALAARRHPSLEFRQASVEQLPFEDGSFEVVVANFGLLHLGRPEQAVAEFVRVLADGGRLALTVWDGPERSRFLGVFLDAIAEAGANTPADIPAGPPFFRFSDERALTQLLREQSLEDIKLTTISFHHVVSSADELWQGLLDGAVRTSALIERQNEQTQQSIRAAFNRIVEDYRVGDHFELPVAVKLAASRKPGELA